MAQVMGLSTDLGLNSTQYGFAMMLFFVAYVFCQVPSNVFLAKGRPSIWLPLAMVIWGIACMSTAFVRSAGSLYLVRFLMGFLEAPFIVGCLFLISSWYTRTEMALRTAILLSASLSAHGFSGLISHAVYTSLEGSLGLRAWRWLYIIAGTCTVVVACWAFFVLPDYPNNTRWLHAEERAVAELRLIADRGAADYNVTRKEGFIMALRDWRVCTFAVMYFLIGIGTSLHNFFPSLVKTLGFSTNKTLWMRTPPYLVTILVVLPICRSSDRFRNASWHIIVTTAMAMIGFLVFLFVQSTDRQGIWFRYATMFPMLAGAHAAHPVQMAWTQKTISQPKEMRAVAVAIVNTAGTIAGVCRKRSRFCLFSY